MIFSIWPGGADFLPDSSTTRVGNAEIVFPKAHSGRGIFTVGTDI